MLRSSGFILAFIAGGVFLFSCAPKSKYIQDTSCQENAKEYQSNITRLEQELALKDQRLSEIGLLDENKQLKSFKVMKSPAITGNESWQK